METKKSKKANLENKRGLFLEVGLILTLGLVLGVLEWSSGVNPVKDLNAGIMLDDDMIEIPNTYIKEKPKPLAPPPIAYDLKPVDDDIKLDEEIEMIEIGDPTDIYDLYTYVEEKNIDDDIFTVVETMPKFMGGETEAFWAYVMKQLKYPERAMDMGIQGVVLVNFVVDKKGNITDLKIIRSADDLLANEVKRVIAGCPKWEAGKQRDKPVNVVFTMPFKFQLN